MTWWQPTNLELIHSQASAALSALGFAMVVLPRLFIDGLVDTQHLQLPSLLQAADASAQLHPKHIAAIAKVQLITCRCAFVAVGSRRTET